MKMPHHISNFWMAFAVSGVLSAGCTDMYDHQRVKPLQENKFYRDGLSARPLVEGTVARGHENMDDHLYLGTVNGKLVDEFPFPATLEVIKHGQDRYNTFCSPCHSRLGDGNGMIVRRGFPKPNSFHSDSVRNKPTGYYFDVITNGFGRMYSYAPSVPVKDRWAIVAYIRALQLSQRARFTDLSADEQSRIAGLKQ